MRTGLFLYSRKEVDVDTTTVVCRGERQPFLPTSGSRGFLSSAFYSAHWGLASKAQLRLRGRDRRSEQVYCNTLIDCAWRPLALLDHETESHRLHDQAQPTLPCGAAIVEFMPCDVLSTRHLIICSIELTGEVLYVARNRVSSSSVWNVAGSLARCLMSCPTISTSPGSPHKITRKRSWERQEMCTLPIPSFLKVCTVQSMILSYLFRF
jgi:hypothetical protein